MKKPAQVNANIDAHLVRYFVKERVDATMQGVYRQFINEVVLPALEESYPATKPKQKRKK